VVLDRDAFPKFREEGVLDGAAAFDLGAMRGHGDLLTGGGPSGVGFPTFDQPEEVESVAAFNHRTDLPVPLETVECLADGIPAGKGRV
jgi:hypothetical protein